MLTPYGIDIDTCLLPENAKYTVQWPGLVYQQAGLTLLNRWPIDRTMASALSGLHASRAGATASGEGEAAPSITLPFPAKKAIKRLCTEGPFVVMNPIGSVSPVVEPTFIEDLRQVEATRVLQQGRNAAGVLCEEVIEWVYMPQAPEDAAVPDPNLPARWEVQRWKNFNGTSPEKVGEALTYDARTVFVWPADPPKLFWGQFDFYRLEELSVDIRKKQKANKGIMRGDIGNVNQVGDQFKDEDSSWVVVPGDGNIMPPAVVVIEQLLREYANLRDEYLAQMCVVDDAAVNRPVAGDRLLRMDSMLSYIDELRVELQKIYAKFQIELTFARIIIKTASERNDEADLYDRLRPFIGEAKHKQLMVSLTP